MKRKEYSKAYYLANKETIRKKSKIYRDAHKEEHKVRRKKYYKANKAKMNAYGREYYSKNSKKVCEQNRNTYLKREFGITNEQYNEMLVFQNYVCAICCQPETATLKGAIKRLAVDHCHETNKIRGLLCQGCNQAIGYARDNTEILTRMIDYLKGL